MNRNEYFKQYREKNRLKLRKYNREYNKNYRELHSYKYENNWTKIHQKKFTEKYLAHSYVYYYLKTKKIVKNNCCICGIKDTVAHHEDYSKPLDVIWICKPHHRQYHLGKISLPKI